MTRKISDILSAEQIEQVVVSIFDHPKGNARLGEILVAEIAGPTLRPLLVAAIGDTPLIDPPVAPEIPKGTHVFDLHLKGVTRDGDTLTGTGTLDGDPVHVTIVHAEARAESLARIRELMRKDGPIGQRIEEVLAQPYGGVDVSRVQEITAQALPDTHLFPSFNTEAEITIVGKPPVSTVEAEEGREQVAVSELDEALGREAYNQHLQSWAGILNDATALSTWEQLNPVAKERWIKYGNGGPRPFRRLTKEWTTGDAEQATARASRDTVADVQSETVAEEARDARAVAVDPVSTHNVYRGAEHMPCYCLHNDHHMIGEEHPNSYVGYSTGRTYDREAVEKAFAEEAGTRAAQDSIACLELRDAMMQPMTLGAVITYMSNLDPEFIVGEGLKYPCSYRGNYSCLAFEQAGSMRVADVLAVLQSAVGSTYPGWKGGEFTMTLDTPVFVAERGDIGVPLSYTWLAENTSKHEDVVFREAVHIGQGLIQRNPAPDAARAAPSPTERMLVGVTGDPMLSTLHTLPNSSWKESGMYLTMPMLVEQPHGAESVAYLPSESLDIVRVLEIQARTIDLEAFDLTDLPKKVALLMPHEATEHFRRAGVSRLEHAYKVAFQRQYQLPDGVEFVNNVVTGIMCNNRVRTSLVFHNRAVGYVEWEAAEKLVRVTDLHVAEDYRRFGIATLLLLDLVRYGNTLSVHTRKDQEALRALCAALRFKPQESGDRVRQEVDSATLMHYGLQRAPRIKWSAMRDPRQDQVVVPENAAEKAMAEYIPAHVLAELEHLRTTNGRLTNIVSRLQALVNDSTAE